MERTCDYWFTIEPYVFIGITNKHVLLYNTLDGITIESDKDDVVNLLHELVRTESCGVVLLTNEQYKQKDINDFIQELRDKYMGDIINICCSKIKPVQLLPYYDICGKIDIYKNHNFSVYKNILDNLSEINIYVDSTIDVIKLIHFLQSIPKGVTFNIVGDVEKVPEYEKLLYYFNQLSSPKNILCSYKNVIVLQPNFENNFSFKILVDFPVDMQQWERSRSILLFQTLPIEYVFDVSSEEECLLVEQIVDQFQINRYQLKPVYTGSNINFFEENIYLNKEDILSIPLTIKDIFSHQAMNIYNFGKINVMPNGDSYANLTCPILGNIYIDSIYEIVQREVDEGKSWFNIRNQAPCNTCVYQWLCPSPSDYEISIGKPNLCHVVK
ncbi:TIGR04150 pseudo-rSAM protein [Parabacteroides johnsonii]|uniref:TIGR04150 pseudo-rSAM protein n=1 Tax=Parabacteroides johnsonii TaxID=387661 RepID=UPI00242C131E|nr:TIGR04150 pseudo-rSAM protein [Parabacteroides johnsonii]MBS6225575.1 TIGR04150 pseudo-rSAM protein [Parabacteroides johnsonii]